MNIFSSKSRILIKRILYFRIKIKNDLFIFIFFIMPTSLRCPCFTFNGRTLHKKNYGDVLDIVARVNIFYDSNCFFFKEKISLHC